MPALIDNIDNSGPAIYYTDTFRQMIEDHLLVISSMSTTQTRTITDDDWATLYRFEGDFYGLLNALGYDRRYHWTILRMNGYRSRFEATDQITTLLLPDWAYIDKLAQLSKEKK
ncbi:hypothetical protein [Ralstonia phage RSF1]|uniref:Uncharacterized protein n=1 Tax=Ralstonia phage RSF1 TaxID=1689679 RepID=A0A0K2QR27_9CAUD|nr:hypothetical protein AVU11_gp216 [Ralstonia phage RSF1]BAS05008.1 hypothetical protein [Ralstonia phage RSF1]